MGRGALSLFHSYAHEDIAILEELHKHLMPLRHEGIIADWYDRELRAGEAWQVEISAQLQSSDIVVALVSPDFIASDYAYGRELARALELHEQEDLRVVPVIARECLWQSLPIADLQVLPDGGRPIMEWESQDAAFVSVVRGIEATAQALLSEDDSLVDDWLEHRLIRRRVIRSVQEYLAALGFYAGPIDGIPGADTERAVRHFQQAEDINVDSMIGPEVIRHLEARVDDQDAAAQ